jgi:hypothetical protein
VALSPAIALTIEKSGNDPETKVTETCNNDNNNNNNKPFLRGHAHRGSPGSNPGLVMWDLRQTKWHWGRFSPSTSVSPANLCSTNFSTVTITYYLGLIQ